MTSAEGTPRAVELIEAAVGAKGFDDLSARALPILMDLARARGAFLHLSDFRLPSPSDSAHGLSDEEAAVAAAAGPDWFDRLSDEPVSLNASLETSGGEMPCVVHPLLVDERVIGLVGVVEPGGERLASEEVWGRVFSSLGLVADRLVERIVAERKVLHLNTYLTVSSMLSKSVDLSELLEIALYCSMEAASGEAASILLLDEEKENFRFYSVEGVAKPLLGGSTFPASEGVAGRVLASREAEVVNDVETDPQFYGQIDERTGFHTRNMIAVPLVAGEEPVGVLEVLNRTDGGSFTADERQILVSVAEEIAFAVRNATIFDYVVNTYCKRRQGENSCSGCERPLGSWTPCMRYREFQP
jgi:hypothetical protein